MNKSTLFKISVMACLFMLTDFTFSTELVIDNFNYSAGPLAANGGWTSFILQTGSEKSAAIEEVAVVDVPLVYAGYLSSNTGKSIVLDGLNKDVYRLFPYIDGVTSNKTSGGADISTGGRVANGDVYAAMLINMERAFYGAGDPEDTKGDCFFAFGSNTWGIGAAGRIYTRKMGNGYQIGVTRAGNAKTVWDATERNLNTTYLIILKYSIVASPNGEKNDRVYLAINPVLGATEPTWIANDATDANAELPSIVGAVQFLQKINTSANNPLTVTARLKVSGLRVATTWDEVGQLNPSNGIHENDKNDFNVYSKDEKIIISTTESKSIQIYDLAGKMLFSQTTNREVTEFSPKNKGVFVVVVNNQKFKVIV